MGSTHMVDHANSFDHYDSLFCAGPHQIAEIRKREAMEGLPQKNLYEYGHPRLEQVIEEGRLFRSGQTAKPDQSGNTNPVILLAPTWGETSIFNVCGASLIGILLDSGFQVIMRPHYHSKRLTPGLINAVREQFQDHERFQYVDQMGETESILRSDLLISDWSAMALEYALGLEKPVLFIDVPRRIRNPDWQKLEIEPIESSIREQLGSVVSPQNLESLPGEIRSLLADQARYAGCAAQLRENAVFNLGSSVERGALELARLADQQSKRRLASGGAHG
jgi:YidC/Oxa1 family membrane protein insertase